MSFVPGYRHDIFVSYAHVDDEQLPIVEKPGWVTTFVSSLRTTLAQRLGGSAAYSMWMDHDLAGNAELTPEIMSILEETATFVLVLSPAYLASDWCGRERRAFMNLIDRRDKSRVFVVEHTNVARCERPSAIRDLVGYRFWRPKENGEVERTLGWPVPNPEKDQLYYNRLVDLAKAVADELSSLRGRVVDPANARPEAGLAAIGRDKDARGASVGSGDGASAPTSDRGAVFLAVATDDLDRESEGVRRYLDQAGIPVLPKSYYSPEPVVFQESVERDLAESAVFVQLLSRVPGKHPPDLPQGYVRLQYDLACEAGVPVLQWRHRRLTPDEVEDKVHRQLIELNTVRAEPIEDFKRTIQKRVQRLEKERAAERAAAAAAAQAAREAAAAGKEGQADSEPESAPSAFVFVDMETKDRGLAIEVCEILLEHGAEYVLPAQTGTPAEARRNLERNLEECDGLIVIYGQATQRWVQEQLMQCRKILARRTSPLRALAVFEGPPGTQPPLGIGLRGLQILDCRNGMDDAVLRSFIDSLKGGSK